MLSLFLILNFRQLFSPTKYPNVKRQTEFIVNHKENTRFNFLEYQKREDAYNYTHLGYNYIVRFAKELSQSDLPSYADYETIRRYKVNAVRCSDVTQKCDILSNIYEYDWNTISDAKPETGCIYFADGQPFLNDNDIYEEWEVHFEFRCNTERESDEPQIFTDEPFDNMPRLYLLFKNKLSCGESWQMEPTPTPQPFNPDCTVYYRLDGNKNRAIYFNLSEWNNGMLGIPAKFITSSGNKTLFWQPCERMVNCPWGANCHGATLSSAWLCDEDVTDCTNYTLIPGGDNPNLSYVDTDLIDGTDINKGFRIKYNSSDKVNLQVDMTCKSDFPNDHVLFDPTAIILNDVITISGSTYDACPTVMPEPVPPFEQCHFNLTQENKDHVEFFIDMDLLQLGKKSKQVTVEGDGKGQKMQLMVWPCDSMPCPDSYDCDGDEDATVYLCEIESKSEAPPACIAYGLLNHGVSVNLKGDYIINGATAHYTGDRARKAEIDFKCNHSVISHEYTLPDKVYLKDGKLSIDVQSIEACYSPEDKPTPTPPPFVKPDVPTPVLPTPTPVPSPQAMYLFENNNDEFVVIDLARIGAAKTFVGEAQLFVKGKEGTIHTEFHPWNLINYPKEWGESSFDKANLWQCWFTDGFDMYCHAAADKRLPGLNVSLQDSNDIEKGVSIIYSGAYGASLKIDINCLESATGKLDLANVPLTYSHDGNSHLWYINTSLDLACANKYQQGSVPYPTTTPEPPSEKPSTSFVTEVDGKQIRLDLGEINSFDDYVATGYSNKYSHNRVVYSPVQKVGCPSGASCPTNDENNIWICLNESFCHSIGNMDYGLTMRMLSEQPYGGVTVNYDGGYHGSETHISFFCDESLEDGEQILDKIDYSVPPGRIHMLTIKTSLVCPDHSLVPPSSILGNTTVGAIFLIAVSVAFVCYFGIGTLVMYIISGGISIPNEGFWVEFFECIMTAITFIFTCGRSRTVAAYDNI